MVGLFSTTRTATLGDTFIGFDVLTQDSVPEGIGREDGYVQLKMTAGNTATLAAYAGVGATALGYEILGEEFRQIPAGFTTFIGISTGYWAGKVGAGESGQYMSDISTGAGCTQYVLVLSEASQHTAISIGDFVQLPQHTMSPDLTLGVNAGMKDENNATLASAVKGLRVCEKQSGKIVVTGFTTDPQAHSPTDKVGDYISIRRKFTIAKGRVGVI